MYQRYYHNAKMNAVVQDAFLGRGIFSLLERRHTANILGDEIVRRKVNATNVWIDYVWKIELREPKPPKAQEPLTAVANQAKTPQAALEVLGHRHTIALKP